MPEPLWDQLMAQGQTPPSLWPDAAPVDPNYQRDPFEVAAQRVRQPYRNIAAPGSSNLGPIAEALAPTEPWEYGLMVAGPGPGLIGRGLAALPAAARLGAAAAGFALTPSEAQAGGKRALLEKVTGFAPDAKLLKTAEEISAPGTIGRSGPTADDIAAIKEAAVGYGRKGWPTAEREVFKTTPEAYAETTDLVPQISIKDRLPGPLPGEKLPNKGRADPIVANTEAISDRIAERLDPLKRAGSELLKFYHTGPVIRGLEQYGGQTVPEANLFMRDWAGQGAATSPRTQTPPNLRNSSYLLHERASGNPLTPQRYAAEGNIPGFPMMGMHVDLADKFARGTENALTNPKPTTFRENWSGNLRDVTGDTHNIRSTLFEADQVSPGSLPRGWFTSDEAYKKYKTEGFRAVDAGDIADTLGDKTVKGIRRQSEYLPMTAPWYRAAEKVGVHPAEAQSGGWFSYGDITGLQSPPKTITNLLNDQIEATAKAINVPSEKVVDWWSKGKIPLAGVAGGALAPALFGGDEAQAGPAKAVGDVLYHGTSKDKGFSSLRDARNGTWFSTNPKEASDYAASNDSMGFRWENSGPVKTNQASRVIPMTPKFEKTLELDKWPKELVEATNYKKAQGEYFDKVRAKGYDSVRMKTDDGHSVVVSLDNSKLSPAYTNADIKLKPKALFSGAGALAPALFSGGDEQPAPNMWGR